MLEIILFSSTCRVMWTVSLEANLNFNQPSGARYTLLKLGGWSTKVEVKGTMLGAQIRCLLQAEYSKSFQRRLRICGAVTAVNQGCLSGGSPASNAESTFYITRVIIDLICSVACFIWRPEELRTIALS